jgi:L-tryptophan---pyruvate aminotransferase
MIDLTWGNPEFLYPYWKNKHFIIKNNNLSYIYGGIERLKDLILNLHSQQNNANVKDKFVVIGNGASQLLTAAMKAYGKPVWATPPYFSRFPFLADIANVPWDMGKDCTQIITSPNNPDGSKSILPYSHNIISDLCYNWKQYTGAPLEYNHPLMIFSLSKATGHASSRIGWALVKDKEIADKMTEFVEHNTAGVSIESQLHASYIIENQLESEISVFDYGKTILDQRWYTIRKMKNLPFKVLNRNGMFLYAEGECPPEVICLRGNSFGDSSTRFRVNIGCDEKKFNQFIDLLI